MLDVQVWRQAATQVFFALGLGYGSVIAYSSYNPVHNNCHRDAIMVSGIHFMTSVLTSLVVFVVPVRICASQHWWPWFNMSDEVVALQDYREWYSHYGSLLGSNITDCDMEREMRKEVEDTGLMFIAFTEAMALFPASPFWLTLFFLMLLNLGLSTMFVLGRHKTMLTVCSCILGFFIGLLFTQRSGNYFVTMFDNYSATLPMIIVVVFETVSVAWIYSADRFLDAVEVILHWRPPVVYDYLWKYVGLLGMVGLLAASLLSMVFKQLTYTAWNHTTVLYTLK
uniref:Solute carrier family 6 member 16a n=1 Tax=Sinocyclocheilus grahami TaxID=75366 RepID=A0A672MBY1_SINGR